MNHLCMIECYVLITVLFVVSIMADANKGAEEATEQSVPIYDIPKKPVVAPRTKFSASSDGVNENTTGESKPLVPPKRTRKSTQISSIIDSLNSKTQNPQEQHPKLNAGLPIVSSKPTNIKPKPVLPKPFESPSSKVPPLQLSETSPEVTDLCDDTGPRYIVTQKPKVEEKVLHDEMPDYADPDTVVKKPDEMPDYADPDTVVKKPDEMPDYAEPDTAVVKPASSTPSADCNKYKITSKPFELEEFAVKFPLPQIIRVYSGYYGITEQFSMSEGEELILFFIKSSKIITASTRSKAETYHLPLNSSIQFSPYLQAKSSENETSTYRYRTIGDLIQREEDLPKVVKVFKSFSGVSEESSVSAGDLIFPRKVSGKKKKTVLKCTNKSGQKLKLGLNCVGDFSTDPSDVRMYLIEYIEYINEFPYTAMVFNDNESSKLSCLRTGTVLILEAPQPLRSYICSTDIFGEKDYPIVELPMIMPIQIQCMERPELNMEPIYNKVQHAYENFKPSMIKKSLYPAQNQKELNAQRQFYEEVQKDDGSSHLYDLERPEAIYESIPGENVAHVRKAAKMQLPPNLPPPNPSSPPAASVTSPPVPAVNSPRPPTSLKPVRKPLLPEHAPIKLPPLVPASPLGKSATVPPAIPSKPISVSNKEPNYDNPTQPRVPPSPIVKPSSVPPAIPSKPRSIGNKEPTLEDTTPPTVPETTSTTATTVEEENIAYLKTLDAESMLQLLDDMNLVEYKDSFHREQVDGELLVELSLEELEDLGVTKKIHQKRLMKLINGTSSAKKYEGGIYGTIS